MFFSRDDALVHRHRFMADPEQWQRFDWERDRQALLTVYARCFKGADADMLLGDGSTSYLPSRLAPARIHQLNPEARLIVLLRNPVDRAYSAWWHYLAMGESCQSFEQHLRYESGLTLMMGEYLYHLRRWLQHFPRHQMCLLVFEQMKQYPDREQARVLEFLGVPSDSRKSTRRHANIARVPRRPSLQAFCNYLFQRDPGRRHPLLDKLRAWNLRPGEYPAMSPATRLHLVRYYRKANAGLSELVGVDLERIWFD